MGLRVCQKAVLIQDCCYQVVNTMFSCADSMQLDSDDIIMPH